VKAKPEIKKKRKMNLKTKQIPLPLVHKQTIPTDDSRWSAKF
jgi:hypothetical protein